MITPLHLNTLIRPSTAGVSAGGILPTGSTDGFQRGTLVEMGDGEHRAGVGWIDSAYDENIILTEGDEVYYTGGAPITDPDTGETFVLVHYNSIVAFVRPEDDAEAEEPATVSFGGYTDWIPWSGGECPVEYDVCVMVVLRYELAGVSGDFGDSSYGGNWFWSHTGGDSDIVFYRLA